MGVHMRLVAREVSVDRERYSSILVNGVVSSFGEMLGLIEFVFDQMVEGFRQGDF